MLRRFDICITPVEFGQLIESYEFRFGNDLEFGSFSKTFSSSINPNPKALREELERQRKRDSIHRLGGEAWGVEGRYESLKVYYRDRVTNKFGKVQLKQPHAYPKKSIGRTVPFGKGFFTEREAHVERVKIFYLKFHTVLHTFRHIDVNEPSAIEEAEIEMMLRRFQIKLNRSEFKKLLEKHNLLNVRTMVFSKFFEIFSPHVSTKSSVLPIIVKKESRSDSSPRRRRRNKKEESLLLSLSSSPTINSKMSRRRISKISISSAALRSAERRIKDRIRNRRSRKKCAKNPKHDVLYL